MPQVLGNIVLELKGESANGAGLTPTVCALLRSSAGLPALESDFTRVDYTRPAFVSAPAKTPD
jgi:hypothetical protein